MTNSCADLLPLSRSHACGSQPPPRATQQDDNNTGEGIEFVVFADDDRAVDHDVGVQVTPRPDADVFANDAVGTNFHVSPDFGLGRDDGGGMNHNNAEKAWNRVGEWPQGESLGFPKFFTGSPVAPVMLMQITCVL